MDTAVRMVTLLYEWLVWPFYLVSFTFASVVEEAHDLFDGVHFHPRIMMSEEERERRWRERINRLAIPMGRLLCQAALFVGGVLVLDWLW